VDISGPVVIGIKVIGVEGEKTYPYFMKDSKWANIC
jgi:hypothetical protein